MDTAESAGNWIQASLIAADSYFAPRGFESAVLVYRIQLRGSFLASLINGITEIASFTSSEGRFRYNELIREVARVTGQERAYWFYVTDPDNCPSIVNWVRDFHYDHAMDGMLSSFETDPAAQGGKSRLGLLGQSNRWLLLHEHHPDEEFSITFHAPTVQARELCLALTITDERLV